MRNFKSFALPESEQSSPANPPWEGEAIRFGGMSVIIGANASGKSNIRDALRFIHGISRGYTLAEIIGEKYVEGGVLQWKGIRGGVRETVTRNGTKSNTQFAISVSTQSPDNEPGGNVTYRITVDVGGNGRVPRMVGESLHRTASGGVIFDWGNPQTNEPGPMDLCLGRQNADWRGIPGELLNPHMPALTQILQFVDSDLGLDLRDYQDEIRGFLRTISSVRFLDLDPNSLRVPSIPGQTVLGDKGENLSSVLHGICAQPDSKEALIEWVRELTPLDVVDLNFPEVSLEGKIQLQLVENGGRTISAESASDGTLRFLAYAAALLGTNPARLYFFEEIENGIHPNRAHLLVNLLQSATRSGRIQVIGTTHSPAILNFLDDTTLRDASLVYRHQGVSKIRSFGDIPDLAEVVKGTRAGVLHGAGWFEDAMAFLEGGSNP